MHKRDLSTLLRSLFLMKLILKKDQFLIVAHYFRFEEGKKVSPPQDK